MENKNSPSTPRGKSILNIKSENTSLNRKPLFQITNLCNHSPMLIKDKPVKHNNEIDDAKENLSPLVSSSSKSSFHSFGKCVSSHLSKRNDGESFQDSHSTPSSAKTNISTPHSNKNIFRDKHVRDDNEVDETKENFSPSISSSSKSSLHSFGKCVSSHLSKRNDAESFQDNRSTPSSTKTNVSTPHSSMNKFSGTPRSISGHCTPKTFIPYNPFELKADLLQLPMVSPSIFKEVVSPSEKEETEFAWNIDNLAILYPVPIESPGSEMEIPLDPEYENKAQEAIDKFFRNTVVVPSPWTDSSKSINLMSAIFSSSSKKSQESSSASPALPCYSVEEKKNTIKEPKHNTLKVSACCQTELSLPPVLPKEVEEVLAPYFTFNQETILQNNDDIEDPSALNTTTLRRKLLFSDEFSSVQQSFSSSFRTSSKVASEKSEVEASSPASIGPLPLDDDDVVLPWSVSMIRPSSCGSDHQPLSSPLQSSTGRKYSSSSDNINCSSGDQSHVIVTPMLSPHGVSPITTYPPKDFRSLPSPSDCLQTPRRRFLSSPKLSPILNVSSQMLQLKTPSPSSSFTTKLPPEISRSPLEYPRGKRGRNLITKPAMSPLFAGPSRENNKINNNYISNEIGETDSASKDFIISECRSEGKFVHSLREINTDSQGFTVNNVPKSEEKIAQNVKLTPIIRSSHHLMFKTSPHFSSSPIKGSNACDSSCSPYQLDTNKFYDKEDNCSSKFSDSPPFSPISWKSDNAGSCDFNPRADDKDESNLTSETMEDEAETCASSSTLKISPIHPSSEFQNEERNNSSTILDKGFDHAQEVIMSSVTYADSEFPNLYEGSTLEEISCGQDTGYQTGNASQIIPPNQSNLYPDHMKSPPRYFPGSTLEEISCGQDTGYQTGNASQIIPPNQSSSLMSLGGTIIKETQTFTFEKRVNAISKEILKENVLKENNDEIFSGSSSH